jgi:RNA polymerase sigma-70 factor (ECF subfamily)
VTPAPRLYPIDVLDAYDLGRRAWPDLELDPQRFCAHVETCRVELDERNAADLFLACACLHGLPHALTAFERTLLARTPQFIAKLHATAEQIAELKQVMREQLFTGATPKIAEYRGRGPLVAWLRVVVIRAAIKLKRSRREQPLPSGAHALALAESSPELKALRNRYRPLFNDAFRAALAQLPTNDRELLRLHFIEGVSMDDLGKRFRVNRSTIFRRINSCTAALKRSIHERLSGMLGLSTTEVESLADLVASDLDFSLAGFLRSHY